MGEVVHFPAPEAANEAGCPHGIGPAQCLSCQHKWMAAEPVGRTWFTCPSCSVDKGTWLLPFHVKVGELFRVCECGNNLFIITPTHSLCPNCGETQGDS